MALTTLISRPFSGIIVDRAGQRGFDLCVIIGSAAVFIAILVLFNTFKPLHMLVAGLLYGLCAGFLQSVMLILSVRIVPMEKRSMANAVYWTAVDTGVALGSFFWGFIAAAFGFKIMFGLTSIPVILAIFVYLSGRTGMKLQKYENI